MERHHAVLFVRSVFGLTEWIVFFFSHINSLKEEFESEGSGTPRIIWVPVLICDLFSRPVLWDSICFMKKGTSGQFKFELKLPWYCLASGWVMQSGSGAVFSSLSGLYFCRQFFILQSLPLQLPLFSLSLSLCPWLSVGLEWLYISLNNLLAVISWTEYWTVRKRTYSPSKQYLSVFPHWIRYSFISLLITAVSFWGKKKFKKNLKGNKQRRRRESRVRATETKTSKGMKGCGE